MTRHVNSGLATMVVPTGIVLLIGDNYLVIVLMKIRSRETQYGCCDVHVNSGICLLWRSILFNLPSIKVLIIHFLTCKYCLFFQLIVLVLWFSNFNFK